MMTNKHNTITETVNELYDLAQKSEAFRSLLAISGWVITFITLLFATKEINYSIIFSIIPLVSIMLIGADNDDDDGE